MTRSEQNDVTQDEYGPIEVMTTERTLYEVTEWSDELDEGRVDFLYDENRDVVLVPVGLVAVAWCQTHNLPAWHVQGSVTAAVVGGCVLESPPKHWKDTDG